jgi:hypothetical protein
MTTRPDHTEAAEYYFTYIDQVPAGDIRDILAKQSVEALALLQTVAEQDSLHRYAPDKWSMREAIGHVNDAERLFVSRAFWFARGFDSPLPSFDQNVAVQTSGAHARAWSSHLKEFETIRAATLSLFRDLPPEAWDRRGTASGNPFTVRALAYISAGHTAHHLKVLRERYIPAAI